MKLVLFLLLSIMILLQIEARDLILSVSDNGIGLNATQLERKEKSFGHALIRAFKNKLDASIDINGSYETKVRLEIKNYKTY